MGRNKVKAVLDLVRVNQPNASLAVEAQLYLKRKFGRKGHHVFIACFPKSGSTYLAKVLADLLDYKFTYFISSFNRTEHDIYLPALVDQYVNDTVTHQHTRATEGNIEILNRFNIKPIILVRNVFDCVISLRDHFERETYKWPMAFATEEYFELPDERRVDFLTNLFVPWYFNFYTSWIEASRTGQIQAKFITYEEWVGNEVRELGKILSFLDIGREFSEEALTLAVENNRGEEKSRFNVGTQGRGLQSLTPNQIQRIKEFAAFYPRIDFSRIGI